MLPRFAPTSNSRGVTRKCAWQILDGAFVVTVEIHIPARYPRGELVALPGLNLNEGSLAIGIQNYVVLETVVGELNKENIRRTDIMSMLHQLPQTLSKGHPGKASPPCIQYLMATRRPQSGLAKMTASISFDFRAVHENIIRHRIVLSTVEKYETGIRSNHNI